MYVLFWTISEQIYLYECVSYSKWFSETDSISELNVQLQNYS